MLPARNLLQKSDARCRQQQQKSELLRYIALIVVIALQFERIVFSFYRALNMRLVVSRKNVWIRSISCIVHVKIRTCVYVHQTSSLGMYNGKAQVRGLADANAATRLKKKSEATSKQNNQGGGGGSAGGGLTVWFVSLHQYDFFHI